MKTPTKTEREAFYREIEPALVVALNEAWPESPGDDQSWSDKIEAISNELRKRWPEVDEVVISDWAAEMGEHYVLRPEPFMTAKAAAAPDGQREAITKALQALDKACEDEMINHDENVGKAITLLLAAQDLTKEDR
jgi:hypothetical protein